MGGAVAIETYPAQHVVAIYALSPDGSRTVGTGALIADGLILTARHVVNAAVAINVRFGLVAGSPRVAAQIRWCGQGEFTDIAVLGLCEATPDALLPVPPVMLGRVARDPRQSYRLHCTALGYPDHARQRIEATGQPYLNSFEVQAQIPLATAWRDGVLHLGVDATTGSSGPWNGMSGAPVFAHGFLVAVVTRTAQPGAGLHLQAVPLSMATGHDAPTLGAPTASGEPQENSSKLRHLLANAQLMLPDADDVTAPLPFVHRESLYTEVVRRLADSTGPVRQRDEELRELMRWCRSGGRRTVWAGESWVGKTTLASSFAASPPPDLDVVSFFCSRTGSRQQADFWWAVSDQLAALLDMPLPQGPHGMTFAALWTQAAQRAQRLKRDLVLLVDGLDELAEQQELLVHLPDGSLPRTHVVIFSRSVPEPSAWGANKAARDVYKLLANAVSAASRQRAEAELSHVLADPASAIYGLLSLIALLGPLTVADLEALTKQAGSERVLTRHRITHLLTDVAVRSIVRREGEPTDAAYVFTHATLKDTFTAEMFEPVRSYWQDVITRCASHWAAAEWPDETPQWITDEYTAYLESTGETPAWGQLLDSDRWAALLLRRTGADLQLRLDSERHLRALSREPNPPLKAIVDRGDRLERLRRPALGLPASMAVAWADAGFPERAERIARERPPASLRSWLFRRLGLAAHKYSQHRDALRLLDLAVEDASHHPGDDTRLLNSALADLARTVGGNGLRWAVLQQLRVAEEDVRTVASSGLPDGTTTPSFYADLLFRSTGRPRQRLWVHAREAADRGELSTLPGMIYALDMEEALGIANIESEAQLDALSGIAMTAAGKHPQHPSLVAVLEAAEDRCVEALKAHRAGAWCESEEAISGLADVVTVLVRRGQWDSNGFMLAESGTQAVVEREAAGARLSACALGAARAGQPDLAQLLLQQAGQGVSTVIARQALVRHWAKEPDVWPQAIAVMNTMNYGRYEEAETVAACLRTGLDSGMDDQALQLLVDYIEKRSPDSGVDTMYAARVTNFIIMAVRGCVRIDRDRSARLLADSLQYAGARAFAWIAYAEEYARRRLVPLAMDGMDRAQRLCSAPEMSRKHHLRALCDLLRTSLRINDQARASWLLQSIEDLARAGRRVPVRLMAFLVRVHRKRADGSLRASELLLELETASANEQDQERQALGQLLIATLRAETDDLQAAAESANSPNSPVWASATSYQPEVYRLLRVTARKDRKLAEALYSRFAKQVADEGRTGELWWVGEQKRHGHVLDLAGELGLWDAGVEFIERLPDDRRAQCLGQLAAAALDGAPERVPSLLAKGFGYEVAPSLLAAAGRADILVTGTCFVAFIDRMTHATRH